MTPPKNSFLRMSFAVPSICEDADKSPSQVLDNDSVYSDVGKMSLPVWALKTFFEADER